MATTPIYAGGARRGAAPSVQLQQFLGTGVGYDPKLLLALLTQQQQAAQQSGAAAPVTPAAPTESGGGSSYDPTTGVSNPNSGGSFGWGQLGQLGGMAGIAGQLARDRDLAQLGGGLGTIAGMGSAIEQALAGNWGNALTAAAPTIGRELGVPGSVVGFGINAAKGNLPGMIDAVVAANPVAGLLNSLSGMLGFDTIGTALGGGYTAMNPDREISVNGVPGTLVSGWENGQYYSYTEAAPDSGGMGFGSGAGDYFGGGYDGAGFGGLGGDTGYGGSDTSSDSGSGDSGDGGDSGDSGDSSDSGDSGW